MLFIPVIGGVVGEKFVIMKLNKCADLKINKINNINSIFFVTFNYSSSQEYVKDILHLKNSTIRVLRVKDQLTPLIFISASGLDGKRI